MKIRLQRSPLLWILLPLIGGYFLGGVLSESLFVFLFLAGALLSVSAAVIAFHPVPGGRALWLALFCAAITLLAAAYYQHRDNFLREWRGLPPRETVLEFQVNRLFPSSRANTISGLGKITKAPPLLSELEGKRIHFSFPADPEDPLPLRFTHLKAYGVIQPVEVRNREEDGFYHYLLQSGIHFRLGRGPPPRIIRESPWFFRFCSNQNRRIESILRHGSSENTPYTQVYVAMLLGKREALSDQQQASFLQTGTFHLFAISGLHIGVIALAMQGLLNVLRMPPVPAAVLGLTCLFVYVEITGSTPSAVRAFLMVAFFWASRIFLRPSNPLSTLGASAVCVLLLFPHQLWSMGFQLSYTVVTAILLLGLPLAEYWKSRWTPFMFLLPDKHRYYHTASISSYRFLLATLGVSLSASLASSPLSIQFFNIFSPGAVALNMFLVPLAFLVISAGFLSVVLGCLGLLFFSTLFNHSAWVLLVIMETAVSWGALLPFGFWEANYRLPFLAAVSTLVLLGSLFVYAEGRGRSRWINGALPFLLFILFLLFGVKLTFLT